MACWIYFGGAGIVALGCRQGIGPTFALVDQYIIDTILNLFIDGQLMDDSSPKGLVKLTGKPAPQVAI